MYFFQENKQNMYLFNYKFGIINMYLLYSHYWERGENMFFDEIFTSSKITPYTLAVVPNYTEDGKVESIILEGDKDFRAELSPTKIIQEACEYFGSSLEGIQETTRKIFGLKHKTPICLNPISGMYFFPSSSPSNDDCHWFAHSHILALRPAENHKTEVLFKNGRSFIVDVSLGSMENQLQRTAQYRFLLEQRFKALFSYPHQNLYQHQHPAYDLFLYNTVAERYLRGRK